VDRRPLLLLCGAGAARGRRPYMEDVHFSFPAVNISGGGGGASNVCSVFGVLDGHGGVECSRFAVDELPSQVH
jgi:serine/threonine protein phosphatase PrpC